MDFLPFLVRYHRLISFSLYILGFVWFVLSLVKKYYLRQVKYLLKHSNSYLFYHLQFSLFAWTHVALLCVVSQSYLIIQNMFQVTQTRVTFFNVRERNIFMTPLTIVLP